MRLGQTPHCSARPSSHLNSRLPIPTDHPSLKLLHCDSVFGVAVVPALDSGCVLVHRPLHTLPRRVELCLV